MVKKRGRPVPLWKLWSRKKKRRILHQKTVAMLISRHVSKGPLTNLIAPGSTTRYWLLLDGILVDPRLPTALCWPIPIYTPGWRESLSYRDSTISSARSSAREGENTCDYIKRDTFDCDALNFDRRTLRSLTSRLTLCREIVILHGHIIWKWWTNAFCSSIWRFRSTISLFSRSLDIFRDSFSLLPD